MGWFSNLFNSGKEEKLSSYCLACGKLAKLCMAYEKCKKCCQCRSDASMADETDDDYEYLGQ